MQLEQVGPEEMIVSNNTVYVSRTLEEWWVFGDRQCQDLIGIIQPTRMPWCKWEAILNGAIYPLYCVGSREGAIKVLVHHWIDSLVQSKQVA